MEPSIGRSIKEGFQVSRRSWPGMLWYAGSWAGVAFLLLMGLMITNPPRELFEENQAAAVQGAPAAQTPEAAKPVDAAQAPKPEAAPAAAKETARRNQVINDWLKVSWPLLVLCLLVLACASIWLTGAQTGYLVQQVRAGKANWSSFASAGSKSFAPLLGGWVVSVGIFAGVLLVVVLGINAVAAIPGKGWGAALGLILGIGIAVLVIWVLVRAAFWFIAIVADGLGPVGALKSSFAATRRRWLHVTGLGLVLAALSYGVWIPSAAVEWAGNRLGGAVGGGIGLIGTIGGAVGSLYMGFLSLAASVRFFDDAKSSLGAGQQPSA